jgi:hypothetical protein
MSNHVNYMLEQYRNEPTPATIERLAEEYDTTPVRIAGELLLVLIPPTHADAAYAEAFSLAKGDAMAAYAAVYAPYDLKQETQNDT